MNTKAPHVFLRKNGISAQKERIFQCIVHMTSGKAVRRSTGHRRQETAQQYAELLQRDIERRAANGDLLPPPANWKKPAPKNANA